MGYSTKFTGILLFTNPLTIPQLKRLENILDTDLRDLDEETKLRLNILTDLSYVDLRIDKDYTGLEWDGAEKTYDLDEIVNVLLRYMQEIFPDFGLKGKLFAQGEDIEDRWWLNINESGRAEKIIIEMTGKKITCPHCEEEFYLESEGE